MKYQILLTLLLGSCALLSQNLFSSSETYAVVVGISDYQDEDIPDLRFADKDALAFAGFLQSPAGGALDKDHLKVLINEQATVAQFAIALDWLMEVVKENDRVIVYFSGHGDVERKTITQPGYLLCWDAPSRVYLAGGALALPMFQDVITTLSAQNKAKVIVITDACRSGKLSGSSVGGAQITGSNLAKRYANEIKILSCQPEEYSIEGEQWGGGRGAFSYHLLDGLTGMADGNEDYAVNLKEIGRYLEDKVTEEVAPQSQNPMVVGNKTEKLSDVFPELLAQLKEGKKEQMQLFTSIASRGIEDEVLARADSNIVEMYLAFQQSLKAKKFLEPENASADFYYAVLSKESQLAKLHSSMRRNYAAALQDDAQQVLNTMLKSGLTEQILKFSKASDLYKNYPTYLQRAAELLGEQHYMYPVLQARKYYFEGQVAAKRKEKRAFYKKALSRQPNMPHAMVELIRMSDADQLDSATYYFQKAIDLVPSWVEPYIATGKYYKSKKQPEKQEQMLQLAGEVDSTSVLVWYEKGGFYTIQKDYPQAEKWFLKVIDGVGADICFHCAYFKLGDVYRITQRYEEAEKQYKKVIQLDSTFIKAYKSLGVLYSKTRRYEEAEKQWEKVIQLDSTFGMNWCNLGFIYLRSNQPKKAEAAFLKALQLNLNYPLLHSYAYNGLGSLDLQNQRYGKAEEHFKKALELNPYLRGAHNHLGLLYIRTGHFDEAKSSLDKTLELSPGNTTARIYFAQWSLKMNQPEQAWQYLEEALKKGYDDYKELQSESDFAVMRKDAKWNILMQKYFPNNSKTKNKPK